MVKGLLRWHQPDPANCVQPDATINSGCLNYFDNKGFDYTSHALGLGVRYKTPIGPLRFDFGYNLNPTAYLQSTGMTPSGVPTFSSEGLRHFNVFFSIGQPF
jgi:outer membrane protein assembly factor BamA